MAIHRGQQGNEPVVGKVNMPDLIPGLAENVAIRETHLFAIGEQALVSLGGKGLQHAIS